METISESIKGLTTIESIDKFNLQYNAIVLAVQELASRGFFDGENTYSDFLATLNHIANYHIIRIANTAYEKYEKGGRADKSWLVTIERCRSSIKEHEDKQVEYDLLDDLCGRLGVRS